MKRKFYNSVILKSLIIILITCISNRLFSQESNEDTPEQYLFPSFNSGTVKMKKGDEKKMLLNYNTLSEKIVFEQGGKYFDLSNQKMIDTAYIEDRMFIPYKEFLLEVVVKDDISFLVQHKSFLHERGRNAGYGGVSSTTAIDNVSTINLSYQYYNLTIPDIYEVKHTKIFWIDSDNTMSSFFNERQFRKLFPDHSDELKKFIKDSKFKVNKIEDMVQIVDYLNDIE